MLTRRHLRIKVLQNLYAFYQSEEQSLIKGEKDLLSSIDKLYDLYVLLLILPLEIKHQAELKIDENKAKLLPSQEDLNPNRKFVDSPVLTAISDSSKLRGYIQKNKLSWMNQMEMVKKIHTDLKSSELYEKFMNHPSNDLDFHKKFVMDIMVDLIANNEVIQSFLEEENVFWKDDLDIAATYAVKTIQSIKPEKEMDLVPMWKNKAEDEQFTKELFQKCVLKRSETDELVKSKADNWELDRIASLDLILMNMAITEAIIFPSIPVKVSLNEYIDLAKEYSTPRSGTFVNGILDKVYAQLKANGTITKTGRGLIG